MLPLVVGDADCIRPPEFSFGWELYGHYAIRQGNWKLIRLDSRAVEFDARPVSIEGADVWGLYNLAVDPGEVDNLYESEPERVAELMRRWDEYVDETDVVLGIFD